jgi:endogenous inhibitor of DNA gyrase (YacG/DUF329 family)
MEILKKGTAQADKKYKGECNHCGTKVSFKASEAKTTYDPRDGDFYTVQCPVCGQSIHSAK